MKYINLTEANAFKALERAPQIGSKDLLTKERIRSCSVPSAQGVAYNYAAMPVTEEVLMSSSSPRSTRSFSTGR